jgi:hypothetical protein
VTDLDRDALLALASTPEERAEILGLDYHAMLRARTTVLVAAVGITIGVALFLIVPIAVIVGLVRDEDVGEHLPIGAALLSLLVLVMGTVVVQVLLRAAASWPAARQQYLAVAARALAVGCGLVAVGWTFQAEPGALYAMATATLFASLFELLAVTSVILSIRRAPKNLGFVVDQHKSLPSGSTILEGRAGGVIANFAETAVVGTLFAALAWVAPVVAACFVPVLIAVELGTIRLGYSQWRGFARALNWALAVALASAGTIATFV